MRPAPWLLFARCLAAASAATETTCGPSRAAGAARSPGDADMARSLLASVLRDSDPESPLAHSESLSLEAARHCLAAYAPPSTKEKRWSLKTARAPLYDTWDVLPAMKVFVKDILKDESGPLTFGFSICREKWTWTLAFVTVDPVRAWPTLAWPTLAWPTVTFPTFDSHPTCGALAVVTCGLTIEAHKYFDELGLRGAVITAAWAFLTTAARSCKALTRRALCPSGQAMDFTAAALGSMLQSPRARALGDWFVVLLAGVVAFGLFGVASWVNECVRALYAFLKPFFKLMPTWFGLLAVAWQFAPCWIKPILSSRLSRCRFFFCALPWVSKALAVLRVVQDLCNIGCQLACDAADAANSAAAVNGAAPRATPVAAPVIIILAPPLSRKLLPSDLAACMVSSEFATMLSARSGVAAARIDVAEEAPCTVVLGCDDSTTAVLDVDG